MSRPSLLCQEGSGAPIDRDYSGSVHACSAQNPSGSKISALTALLILPALPVDEPHKARYLPDRQKPDNEHEYPIYEPGYDDVRTTHRFTKRNPRRFRWRHAGVRPFLTDSGSSPELRLRYART